MNELNSDYYIAWFVYLMAVIAAQFIVWRLSSSFKSQDFRLLLQIFCFSLLIMPTHLNQLQNGGGYWVPAFIAAVMDGLNDGFEASVPHLVPMLFLMLALLCASFLWKLLGKKDFLKR